MLFGREGGGRGRGGMGEGEAIQGACVHTSEIA